MDEITVLNVTGRGGKLAFTYFAAFFFTGIGLVITMMFYRKKYFSWKKKRDPSVDFTTDADVARYSIMIHNLPTNQSPEHLQT
jgi:hypothetical protein